MATDPGRRRLRRAQQRARHLGRLGRQRASPRSTRPAVRRRADRHHAATGAWVLTDADPRALRIADRTLPAGRRGHGRSCCRPTRPRRGWCRVEPGAAVRRWRRSTWCSRCCTGASARTARSRACSRWPACPTSGRACSPAPPRWTRSSPRSCCAAEGLDGRATSRCVRRGGRVARAGLQHLGLPVFVKPARAGSSVGITKVDRLGRAAGRARARRSRHDDKVLVEAAVAGREIECGVLEDADGRPRPACRPRSGWSRGHDWYDFEAKYLDDACEFDVPAELPRRDDRRGPARPRAGPSRALDCAGLARVDFFVTAGRRAWSSTRSTRCRASRRSRCSRGCGRRPASTYPELVDRLIASALRR